ncbi:MAG: serine/threonine-protein kinase [Anaerolineales bacterium]|nr:serine/threonine-protein kinase [Anaerolineales bacterium]
MPLTPGTTLHERYRIESILGQGGMGAVYRAIDINLGVPVAVKENLFTTEEYARQFWREATILAGVRHAHLPRVTDHFVIENEGQYLVMDFIQGEDLRQMLERGGPITEQRLLPWFLEICDALAYLHSRRPPIVHRDVKPGNIKINPDGRALLVDFGLAKIVEDSGSTTIGAKAMTPGFSPPEQYGTGRTDPRSDVYSLGATMYAALTLAIPEDAVERVLGRTKLTPIQKRNSRVSTSMARAVEKALEVKPEDRYPTVSAFAAALSAASGATQPAVSANYPHLEKTVVAPVRPLAIGTDELEPLEVRRRRWPYFVIGGIALVLVIVGSILALSDGRAASSPPGSSSTGAPNHTPVAPGAVVGTLAAASTPSGFLPTPVPSVAAGASPATLATPVGGGVGQIAFASARTGLPQLYLMNADGTDVKQLTDMKEGACQPSWSPDGERLMYITPCRVNQESYAGSGIVILSLADLATQALPSIAGGGDFDPAWSPDGQRVAFTSLREQDRPNVFVMQLDGSGLASLSAPLAYESQAAWSPTGSQLAISSNRVGNPRVFLIPDVGGEAERYSWGPSDGDRFPDWSKDGQNVVFERSLDGFPRLFVARYEAPGQASKAICPDGPLSVVPMAEPRWSPDGGWVALETWPDGKNHNIAIMTAGCTNFTELTTDPDLDFDPAWRP